MQFNKAACKGLPSLQWDNKLSEVDNIVKQWIFWFEEIGHG
jgi:hypothetical protein